MHALLRRATSAFFLLAAPTALAASTETAVAAHTQRASPPAPEQNLTGSAVIRFMTFNIHHGVGADGKLNLDRTADAIRTANPDVVALQEVDVYFSQRSGCKDQVAELASKLGYYYYFSASLDYPGDVFLCGWGQRRRYGNAILSRTPIYGGHKTSLPSYGYESRTLLSAYVSIGNVSLRVHSTHLGIASEPEREAQAASIMSVYDSWGGPGILGGDFNAEPQHWTLAPITNRLTEAFYHFQGPGGVDLIYSDMPTSVLLGIGELETHASDHRPRWADYLIQWAY